MEQINDDEKALLRMIRNGYFRDCYLIYCRKSQDEIESQKNSIKFQRSENVRFATKMGLKVAPITIPQFSTNGIIAERHTAFKESEVLVFGKDKSVTHCIERPKFYRLVQWLHEGRFKGVIFLCWDRASRNKGDASILDKLKKAGVDLQFALARYDRNSSGELHMDIDNMFAEHHSRVTAEKVGLALKQGREEGFWPNRAGAGYLNVGTMEKKPLDPIRAPLITEMARLAATGWSCADLSRWAIGQGFTMPAMRRRRTRAEIEAEEDDDLKLNLEKIARLPTATTIHKILTNRVYTGMIPQSNGEWIPSNCHQAIIPMPLFERVQLALKLRRRSVRYVKRLPHPFRGLVRCGSCRRSYCPYTQKGRLYYGSRCAPLCMNSNRSFNLKFFETQIENILGSFVLGENECRRIDQVSTEEIAVLEANRATLLATKERRKKKLKEDLHYLAENKLALLKTGAYSPEEVLSQETRLKAEIRELEEEPAEKAADITEAAASVKKLSELLKTLVPQYRLATFLEKEEILKNLFSELTVLGKTVSYQCISALQPIAGRFKANSGLSDWLSEPAQTNRLMKETLATLQPMVAALKGRLPPAQLRQRLR